ncbi:MAG TPA: tetratricopeptide repeat protein [Chloroflexia bacterium]|nr:tetratricopeptide repeat protein [Chloroflexia bacterium]
MSDSDTFALWLRERRKAVDFTQEALAERAGLSLSAVRKLEAGKRKPSRKVAEVLANALRIPPEDRARFLHVARGAVGEEASTPNNLPAELTSLVGRDEDVARISSLLRGEVRLATLTGPPGIGKTRLALAVAREVLGSFPDGVFMVPLAPVREQVGVTRAIADVLGLRDTGREPFSLTVREYLQGKRALLVLDNYEQVVSSAAIVAGLLERCPNLKVLVTSREPLHIRGERQTPVASLQVPGTEYRVPSDASALGTVAAVALFVERAREVVPSFRLTPKNAGAAAAICTHLDGLPLAIELVAARMRLLSPATILARLQGQGHEGRTSALHLLTGGARDLPARHRTLRDAIGWSYDLLGEDERVLFARLGVFVGGCTLKSAEAVCNAMGDLAISVLEGLSSLLDKSLLKVEGEEDEDSEPRYRMLETILEYAGERLEASGEEDKVKGWLVEYYLALAQAARTQMQGDQRGWGKRLEAERHNIRAALRWAISSGRIEAAAHLSSGLFYFWYVRGYVSEGLGLLEEVVGHEARTGLPEALQAELLSGAGFLASAQYDFEQAARRLDESLVLSRRTGDRTMIGITLNAIGGMVETSRGNYAKAEHTLKEALGLFKELGESRRAGVVLYNLSLLALFMGKNEQSQTLIMEALPLLRGAGDDWNEALALTVLGFTLCRQGEYEQATGVCNEAVASFQGVEGKQNGLAAVIGCLAEIARRQGDNERARLLYKESLSVDRETTNYRIIAHDLVGLGLLAALEGQPKRATTLFGILNGWTDKLKAVLITPADMSEYESGLASAREALDRTQWALALESGRAMSVAQAINYALE